MENKIKPTLRKRCIPNKECSRNQKIVRTVFKAVQLMLKQPNRVHTVLTNEIVQISETKAVTL